MFAAGKLTAAIELALRQTREQVVDSLDGPRARTFKRDVEILLDTEISEDAPALRHIAHPLRGDAEGRPPRGVLAEDCNFAIARGRKPHQAAQCRGLSRAIAPQQCGDFTLSNLKC